MDSAERKESLNLLDLKPSRKKEWHVEEGRVIISMPRFRSGIGKRFARLMGREENYRVKLDKISSFVWEQCDGKKSVAEIAEALKEKFGDDVEPLYGRLSKLLELLEKNGIIDFR